MTYSSAELNSVEYGRGVGDAMMSCQRIYSLGLHEIESVSWVRVLASPDVSLGPWREVKSRVKKF